MLAMTKTEILGKIIKQAREEKGWSQQELADKMGVAVEQVRDHEEGKGDIDTTTTAAYFFLLNISPNITIYEDDVDDALRMDRMYRELQTLSQEQFDRLCDSAAHIRRWRRDHPGTVTLEEYWKTFDVIE